MLSEIILEQFLGFLVQTLPIGILFFSPFDKKDMHLSGKQLHIAITVLLTILAMFFTAFIIALDNKMVGLDIQKYADMFMFICLLAGGILGIFNVKHSLTKKILILITVIYYEVLIYIVNALILMYVYPKEFDCIYPYTVESIISIFVLTAITYPFLLQYMKMKVCEMLRIIDEPLARRGCCYIGVVLVLFILFVTMEPIIGEPVALQMALCFLACNILTIYMFFTEIHMALQQAKLKERIKIFELEYQVINSNIQDMARFRHDMHHHLGVIGTLNSEGKKEAITEYLKQYSNAFDRLEYDKICDYPEVNTIMKYYLEKTKRDYIQVKLNIQLGERLKFDLMDLTVLLGNCMENAIEACQMLSIEQRIINIEMMKVKDALLILIENNCLPRKVIAYGKYLGGENFISTKNGRWHGLGMGNIQRIAEKYNGSAEFKQEKECFGVRIVLYNQ